MRGIKLLIVLLFPCALFSQNVHIKGIVTDTLNNPLIFATVMLLETDSTLLDFAQTTEDGSFQLKNLETRDYLIKVNYVGYIPVTIDVPSGETSYNLGQIKMTEIAEELMEVVIKAARAPMSIRGDTIEYDASSFRVPEGSTIEDLLKRLPGMEVEQDGTIRADGKEVSKVTVEGKEFFSGDPKSVTKNLPAEGVSKVQVFDRKTEEQKLTGIQSTSNEKEMNINLKDDFKKGGFGKITVGYGDQERGELKGNFNRFSPKYQFSIIGGMNNTGRNGLSWDDYQDFMGSQSFNFNKSGLEYGFGSNAGMRFISFGSRNSDQLENQIRDVFFSRSSGGYPESLNAGINYNYDYEKNKIGSSYFYNYSGNIRETTSKNTLFFEDFTSSNARNSVNENGFKGHRGEFSFERDLDSLHTIALFADVAKVNSSENNASQNMSLKNQNTLVSSSIIDNDNAFDGELLNLTALLRKTFRKKGRFLGANISFLHTAVEDINFIKSDISFYSEDGNPDYSELLDQNNQNTASKNNLKTNLMFSEPLSKKWFFSSFFNFNRREQSGDILALDNVDNAYIRNDFLSRSYTNEVNNYRMGASFTFSHEGRNISLGSGYKRFHLYGIHQGSGNSGVRGEIDQNFGTWLYFGQISLSMGRTGFLNLSYTKDATEPAIDDMLPVVDNRNPLYIREGNPELLPESTHGINFYANKSIPISGIRLYLNANMTFYNQQIIQDQTVDENLITYSIPVNYDGGRQMFGNLGFSFPIIKNKIKSSINYSQNYNRSFSFVNTILNRTSTITYSPRINFDITPNENLGLYLNGSLSSGKTSYNINTSQNQTITRKSLGVEFNTKILKGVFFNSSYNHSFYRNDRFGQDMSIPILNASIYKQFLEGNRGELRFSMYDLLNRNIQFSQFAGNNTVSESTTNSLGRYFILSFTYNIRGLKTGVLKTSY